MQISRFFKSLKWSNVLFGFVLGIIACIIPWISSLLIGENGIVTKIRQFIQAKLGWGK